MKWGMIGEPVTLAIGAMLCLVLATSGCTVESASGIHDQNLQLGMSIDETTQALGQLPGVVCECGGGLVLYFREAFEARIETEGTSIESPMKVHAIHELPHEYGCLQLLFDGDRLLVATAHVGKSTYVHSADGDLEADEFSLLTRQQYQTLDLPSSEWTPS